MFLGAEITRLVNGISINQERYIENMMREYNVSRVPLREAPIFTIEDVFVTEQDEELAEEPYCRVIGRAQYCANASRPDVLFYANLLARFASRPRRKHKECLKLILRYLCRTSDYSLPCKQGQLTRKHTFLVLANQNAIPALIFIRPN